MTEEPSLPVIGKYLAACGAASRRGAVELVKAGRITVNGEVVLDPSFRVKSDDTVAFDGKKVTPESVKRYIMLNKPRGYTCSNSDGHAKKLAVDLIGVPERLFSAGRLDKDSEGLIIFSNDGDYVNTLGHPSFSVCKRYHVRLDRELTEKQIRILLYGITDNGELLKPEALKRIGPALYEFTLNEGRNREIRRMASFCNAQVRRLVRVSVGELELRDLPAGKWRELSEEEIRRSLIPGARAEKK